MGRPTSRRRPESKIRAAHTIGQTRPLQQNRSRPKSRFVHYLRAAVPRHLAAFDPVVYPAQAQVRLTARSRSYSTGSWASLRGEDTVDRARAHRARGGGARVAADQRAGPRWLIGTTLALGVRWIVAERTTSDVGPRREGRRRAARGVVVAGVEVVPRTVGRRTGAVTAVVRFDASLRCGSPDAGGEGEDDQERRREKRSNGHALDVSQGVCRSGRAAGGRPAGRNPSRSRHPPSGIRRKPSR